MHEIDRLLGHLAGPDRLVTRAQARARFPSIRLGVEAHSRQFHFGRAAERRDEDRDHRLARCGWEVLYVGWQGSQRPAEVLVLVVETARHRQRLLER